MPKFATNYNDVPVSRKPEINLEPSQTVPEQSMSVRELLTRYTTGQPMAGMREPVYNGDLYVPDIAHMDLADRQTYLEELQDKNKNTVRELEEQNRKLEEDKLKELELKNTPPPSPGVAATSTNTP